MISQHPQIGWSLTELAPGTAEEYLDELEDLAAARVAYRYAEGQVAAFPGDPGADGAAGDAGGRDRRSWWRPPAQERPGPGRWVPQAPQDPSLGAVVEFGPILCGVCRLEVAPAG